MSDQYIEVKVHSKVANVNKVIMAVALILTLLLFAISFGYVLSDDYDTAIPIGLVGLAIIVVAILWWNISALVSSMILEMGSNAAMKQGGKICLMVVGSLGFLFILLILLGGI